MVEVKPGDSDRDQSCLKRTSRQQFQGQVGAYYLLSLLTSTEPRGLLTLFACPFASSMIDL